MAPVQKSFLEKIYKRLIQGDHNDIKLVFRDGSSTGSKICLAALSPYFEAMFTHDMLEKNNGVVTLPTVSKTTFDDVLKFHYLGNDVVNYLNCFLLLDVAEMMQLDDLKALCLNYLNNNLTLTTDNCIHMWRTLKKYGFEDIVTKAFQYVVNNLDKLSKSGIITDLRTDEYLQVLSRDDLSQKEDEIVQDVQRWITKNNPSVETMEDIFHQIRFEHVSFDYLTEDVIFTNFVKEHEALQIVVQKGLKRHYLYKETHGFCDNRISGQMCDVMFVLQHSSPVLSVVCLTEKRWYELPACPFVPSSWFSSDVVGTLIYITGGFNTLQRTIIYNTWRKKWLSGPDLKQKRKEHCMAVLDETLYVIGGSHSSSIEQLQSGHYEWEVVGDLGCKRRDSCAEAVGENIMVMGGKVDNNPSNRMHCFNTKTHTVTTINTQMKIGKLTRSYLEMPTLYLLHYGGEVDIIHIDDVNTPTLTAECVAKYEQFGYHFGFVFKDDSIIVVSQQDIQKLYIIDGSRESLTFDNTPPLRDMHQTLNMLVPHFCLL